MRRNRNVKIVATVGPACSTKNTLRKLVETGVDVFRLNMSHGTHEDIAERHALIRAVEDDLDRPIAILGDVQGPKLRVGLFEDGPITLEAGRDFRFDFDEAPGGQDRVCLPHPEIFAALKPGATMLVNDGKIRLKVESCDASHAECKVMVGGEISNNKGVNVPDVVLPLAALTEKDRKDIDFIIGLGIDWLALSFVQRPEDVLEARKLAGKSVAIMVKAEKPACIDRFDEILAVSDGVMVARGDLGVEMPVHELPPVQKRLIRECRRNAKPVIVATQMLESMISSPVPTRAEVSDVASAIYDGADAVMLSAESATGEYPVEAVAMMDSIANHLESQEFYRQSLDSGLKIERLTVSDAITSAANAVAESIKVKAIACFTHSGATALLMSRERPSVPIIALTPVRATARRLTLAWGMQCTVTTESVERFKLAVVAAVRVAKKHGFATKNDNIVVTAGVPFNVPGTTNILRVAPVDERRIFEGEHD